MLKRLANLTALTLMLTACIPQIGRTDLATLTAERQGDTVTATLTLNQDATQVLVIFTGDDFRREFGERTLAAGVHDFAVVNPNPVSCSASGYVGWQYFLIFCQ
jgi:hypothetical protein